MKYRIKGLLILALVTATGASIAKDIAPVDDSLFVNRYSGDFYGRYGGGLKDPTGEDSSVNSSILDIKTLPVPDKAMVSTCKTNKTFDAPQGKNLRPSNGCRVINYYLKKKWVGAVRVPRGIAFQVPWNPS